MFKKVSFFASALLLCATAQTVNAQTVVVTVKPTFVYQYRGDVENRHTTFQGAYARAEAEIASGVDASTGLVHWRAAGATPSGITYNGEPYLYIAMEVLRNGVFVPSHTTGGYVYMVPQCPAYFREEWDYKAPATAQKITCVSTFAYPEPCDTCDKVGNPLLPSTRVKIQEEVDYRSAGPGGLEFVRTYRSDRNGWQHNYHMVGSDLRMGPATQPTGIFPAPGVQSRGVDCYWGMGTLIAGVRCYSPMPTGNENDFALRHGNGRLVKFGGPAGFAPAPHINHRWTPIFESGVKIANDIYNADNESTERYGLNGLIQRITYRNGHVTRFAYVPFAGVVTPNSPEFLLDSVTDHFGKQLKFTYYSDGRMETMTSPAGEVFTYRYDEQPAGANFGNLTSVTYPNQQKRSYSYNEPEHNSGFSNPFALTGITDENGARYATFKYNSSGYAMSTEHAGEVGKYKIISAPLYQGIEYRYLVDPLGATIEYQYAPKPGGLRLTAKSRPAGAGSPAAVQTRSYDANENVESIRDYNGVVTRFEYDLARNLEVVRTDAYGLPEQRKTSTEWLPNYRLPKRIAEPKRLTSFDYDGKGNLKTRSVQATTDATGALGFDAVKVGLVSTWTYTYNSNGQVEMMTGPRTGGVDKTIYAYDPQTGDLLSITNAAGHVTTFSDYDMNGRARLITAPNRTSTRLSYSTRGWLESRTVSDGTTSMTTTYGRDNVGQLTSVTNPDNTVITYVYDDAHRLTDIYDTAGNKIHYVLNNMGSPLTEEVTDPSGALKRQVTNQYDILNRLEVKTGGAQ